MRKDLRLVSPEYALSEINRYSKEICLKTGCSAKEFKDTLRDIASCVNFIPPLEYSSIFKELTDLNDPKDIDFIALAKSLGCPLWSNDAGLKEQRHVTVFTTKELVNLL
jgi:predicted nucleic acid-binding protein